MYKLLLVDDEPEIREGLRELIPFADLGFEVVGEAGNGVSALQLAEALEPDLIITDIRMPLMDGLTMCRKLRPILPTAQFIILSGYDDFEYARQAIEVRTLGYLLKPISAEEFTQMLRGAKHSLDEAARQRSDVQQLKQAFHASLPQFREGLLSSLLTGGLTLGEALRQAERYDMRIQAPAYAVLMMQLGSEKGPDKIGDPELLSIGVLNIMQEVLDNAGTCMLFRHGGMMAGLYLLREHSDEALSRALEAVEEGRRVTTHYLRCALYIGVSTPCGELAALPAAARQAVSALDQARLTGEEQTLCVKDVERGSSTSLTVDDLQLRQLTNALKVGDRVLAEEALQAILDRCRNASPTPKAYQTYLMEVFMCFLRVLPDMGLEREDFDEAFDHISKRIFTAWPSIDEAQQMFTDLLQQLVGSIVDSRRTAGLLIAQQAEDYLKAHFSVDSLALEDLCLHLHVSPSYFSSVFKKETRQTFHQYLTGLRMDKALQLLRQTDLRTSQVAREVGLPDPSYFSYCFKKHYGFPPSQARRRPAAP